MTTTTKLAEIVSMLVEVARAAHYAMDNCGDLLLTEDGAEKLSSALDALDELPEIDDWYVRDGWCKAKDWLIALNAYTTPQPSADAVREVPGGMVLVPMEPTREMIEAGVMFGNSPNKVSIIYQSMVIAAASDHQQNAAQGGGDHG